MKLELKYREENDRENYLGASEVGGILGLNKYMTPFDVWAAKNGHASDFSGNLATERGHRLEGAVLNWGCDLVGASEHVRGGDFESLPVQSDCAPWAAFHPDGWITVDGRTYLAEVKTSRFGDGWDDDGIPAHCAAQVRYQLALCGDDVAGCYVFALVMGTDELELRLVERDAAEEKALISTMAAWWAKYVDGDDVPELDNSAGTNKYLERHVDGGIMEDATVEEGDLYYELSAIKARLKLLTSESKTLENKLKDLIGDRQGIYIADAGKVTWKAQKAASRLDRKALKISHPAIESEFSTRGKDIRVLRLPRVK